MWSDNSKRKWHFSFDLSTFIPKLCWKVHILHSNERFGTRGYHYVHHAYKRDTKKSADQSGTKLRLAKHHPISRWMVFKHRMVFGFALISLAHTRHERNVGLLFSFKENADIFLDRAKIPLNRPFLLTQTQIELAYSKS